MKKLFNLTIVKIIFLVCFTFQISAKQITTKCLIIGSGPAGVTAAIHTARAGLNTILITGKTPGSQLNLIQKIENYPGFVEPIKGSKIMKQMINQAKRLGVTIVNDHVTEVKLNSHPFTCFTQNNNEYIYESLIIATGAQSHWLGIPGEKKFKGHGVSYCVTCEGYFYKNKNIAVIGGGDSAVKNALYLSNLAKQVTLIISKNTLSASKKLQTKILLNKKVKILYNTTVEEIFGDDKPLNMAGLKIKNLKTQKSITMPLEGIFIAIEHTPNTHIFKDFIKLDEEGYIITPLNSTQTNIKGVFAAGDVQKKTYRYAITAAYSGFIAAMEAKKYLS